MSKFQAILEYLNKWLRKGFVVKKEVSKQSSGTIRYRRVGTAKTMKEVRERAVDIAFEELNMWQSWTEFVRHFKICQYMFMKGE